MLVEMERISSKYCVILFGKALPKPEQREVLLPVLADLIMRKWALRIKLDEVGGCHRLGNQAIIKFNCLQHGSAHHSLLNRWGN